MKNLHIQAVTGVGMALLVVGCATQRQVEHYVDEPIDFSKRGRLVDGPDGARLVFPDGLLFDTGSPALKADAARNIDACMFIIERHRGQLLVEGHTDKTGPKAINVPLSKSRAEAVRLALVQRKIAPSRIETVGLADTKAFEAPGLKGPATDEEQYALNRRAEVIFKGQSAASLDAPWGCGGPPAKRRVMVDAPPSNFEKIGQDLKKAVDKATSK